MTRLFICWSGDQSRAVAEVMARRLPAIVGGLKCSVSTQIEPGAVWSVELQRQLDAADAGLVCLTPAALESTWIHYEAGLLAAAVGAKRGTPSIFTYLVNLEARALTGPLSAYQAAAANRDDTARLVDLLIGLAGGPAAIGFDGWWATVEGDLRRIPLTSLEDVVPGLQELFRSQTFVEPMSECTDQRWLGRHSETRELFRRLDERRSLVRAACPPAVAALYDDLCRLLEAYAMDIKAHFLVEKRFQADEETGRLRIEPAALSAERRRADIAARVSQLADAERTPLMDQALAFEREASFGRRKDLVHKARAEIESGRLALAREDLERAAFSDWDFDRIVAYLLLERQTSVRLRDALRGIEVELEKVRAHGLPAPSHMPLHYAIGPLVTAARDVEPHSADAARVEHVLSTLQTQIEEHDDGGRLAACLADVRRALQKTTNGDPKRI
jgi:TIR domain